MNFPLQNNENLMRHEIYAEIENNDLAGKLKTDTEEVFYCDGYVQATKITMINTAHGRRRSTRSSLSANSTC